MSQLRDLRSILELHAPPEVCSLQPLTHTAANPALGLARVRRWELGLGRGTFCCVRERQAEKKRNLAVPSFESSSTFSLFCLLFPVGSTPAGLISEIQSPVRSFCACGPRLLTFLAAPAVSVGWERGTRPVTPPFLLELLP